MAKQTKTSLVENHFYGRHNDIFHINRVVLHF